MSISKCYKKIFSYILITLIVFFSFSISNAQTKDYKDHWASDKISEWIEQGLIKGYDQCTFKPDNNITRGEFAALINRSFGFSAKSEIDFTDVPNNAWYSSDIKKAKAAGYLDGYEDKTVRPENPITREEAACIIDRIITANAPEGLTNLTAFTDANYMSGWSKEATSAVITKVIFSGYPDKTFKPTNNITRAETVIILDKALNVSKNITIYKEAKVYGPSTGVETITGDAVISTAGVQLQNILVTGDLTISKSVGEGDIILNNVCVEGTVYIKGGGSDSIHLNNCLMSTVYVDKSGVRVVAEGTTTVQEVRLVSVALIEEQGISGEGFVNAVVSQYAPIGISATLNGDFNNVTINADQTKVNVLDGTIGKLHISQGADGTEIDLSNDVTVNIIDINSRVAVTGKGTINTAINNVLGSTFETQPKGAEAGTGAGTETGAGTGQGTGNGVALLNYVSACLTTDDSLIEGSASIPVNPKIRLTFDRGIVRDYWDINKDCIKMTDSSGKSVPIKVTRITDNDLEKKNIYIEPTGSLTNGKTYYIEISEDLTANNGNTLGTAKTISFKVVAASGSGGGDSSSPVFSENYPKIENINLTSFDLKVKANENGTVYYIVLEDNSPVPTSEDVKVGFDASGLEPVVSGSFSLLNIETTKSIENLDLDTAYDLYIVSEDNSSNLQANHVKLDVVTDKLLTSSNLTFDKNPSNQSNIIFEIKYTDKIINSLAKGSELLVSGSAFSIVENNLIINKEYLMTQNVGSLELTAITEDGLRSVNTITIIDTANTPIDTPAATSGYTFGEIIIEDDTSLASKTLEANGKALSIIIDNQILKTYIVSSSIKTKDDFISSLNSVLEPYAIASFNSDNHVVITSKSVGSNSSVAVRGPSSEIIGSTPEIVTGDIETSGYALGTVAVLDDAVLSECTQNDNGKVLTFIIDGQVRAYIVTSSVTTRNDFINALNDILGSSATASFTVDGYLKVTSATTGAGSTVIIPGKAKPVLIGPTSEIKGVD